MIRKQELRIILVSKSPFIFEFFAKELSKSDACDIIWVATGKEGLMMVEEQRVDVMVVDTLMGDGEGHTLIKQLALLAPHVHSALVSSLTPSGLHQQTEGVGILMQLPENPGAVDAKMMLKALENIGVLHGQA